MCLLKNIPKIIFDSVVIRQNIFFVSLTHFAALLECNTPFNVLFWLLKEYPYCKKSVLLECSFLTSNQTLYFTFVPNVYYLEHGSHLEQRFFASTKWLGRHQVQASRFMAQVIVLVIINAMIGNDWKTGMMDES